MNSFINRLLSSAPTLDPDESRQLLQEVVAKTEWIVLSSRIMGWDQAVAFADHYVSFLSEVLSSDSFSIRTPHPIYIFAEQVEHYKYIGLLFSNGAVVYTEGSDDGPTLLTFIDRTIADALRIPYVDVSGQRIHHMTVDQAKAMFFPGESDNEQTSMD
jgi:hypothetical protein